jgi:hypothetical protein
MLPELPAKYMLPVDRADWHELLAQWTLLPKNVRPWLLTKFGELIVEQEDGAIGILQTSAATYSVIAKDATDFCEWLADPDKLAEWFLAPLVDRLEKAGRTLTPDRCYCFKQPLCLGGGFDDSNIGTIAVRESFLAYGELFRQIKDLPDGAQINIKITE